MTESTWSIKLESEKKILWTGSTKTSPDISKLSQLLPITLSFNDLTAITVQILTSAPLDKIPTLLTALCSVYLRSPTTGAIDMNALSSIAATEHRMVCGRVFKKGDIVWNCRTCGKDPTCVQCDPCFRKSNHTGHEVYFHRAEGGSGCCDCGDLEAWAVHGCCSDHQVKEHSDDYDPAAHLPEEVKRGFRAVLQACFGWISSYLIFTVRSFEPFPDNMILQLLRDHYPTKSVVLRIHNDDVHTYDEVIQTFRSVGFTSQIAQDLTKQVDKEGNAIILNINVANERLDEVYNIITNAGLIYSIYPIELLSIEKRIPVILTSLITLGEFSDGFRRIISEELLRSVTSSSVTSNIAIYSWPELLTSFTLQTMFEAEGQFPIEITQLSSIEFLSLPLSGNISHNPSNATTTSNTTENELKDRIRRPLRYCDTNPLSLLILSSPFIPVPIQKVLIDIIMKFQHDYYFKNGFSQLITILYPPLKLLYCRHYGLSGETIFRTTVQVYTANSIVELMSTPIGIKKRLLTEIGLPSPYYAQQQQGGVNDGMKYLQITNMLMSVFYTVLKDVGCPTNADFLNHHSIRTHRLSMICRDLEYVTTDPYYCIELLRGHINSGTMELWIDVCSLIQYIDRMRRQVTIHVEHEDEKWQYAANLLLEVESVSEHFIANAFLQSSSNNITTPTATTRQQYFPSINSQQMEDIRSEALLTTIEKVMKGIIHWYHTKQYNVSDPSTEQKMVIKFPTNEPGYELTTTSYLVSINSFSIHIPLHRLFMKLFHFACQGNVSCTLVLNRLAEQFSEREILLLMDYPLRCLVFFSQVNHGLWKRNGIAPMNLAYNYQRIPLNRTLHDMDILSLQITSLLLKDNNIKSFYFFYFQRYELLDWLLSSSTYRINQESMLVLSDLLRVLLQVTIYLPVILFPSSSTSQPIIEGEHVEGVRLALRREVFHQILLGNTSISSLGKLKKLIGTYGTVSDQLLREVLNDLTTTRRITGGASAAMGLGKSKDDDIPAASAGGGEGQAGTIQLKEESYQYYDPEFPSLTSKQVIQAMDVMKERFKQQKGNNNSRQEKIHWNSINYRSNPYLPLIYEKAIPIAHPDFLPLRQKLLLSTTFLEITYRIITHLCLGNSTGVTNDRNYSNRTTLLGRTIELFTVQCYLLPSSTTVFTTNISNEIQAYLKNFNLYHVGYNVIDQFLKVYNENILKEEEIYQEGLAFLLYQSQYWSHDIRNLLISSNFISVDENKEGGNDTVSSIAQNQKEDEKERLRKAAQERLLAQTKARAENAMKAFADLMSSDSEDDEDDEKDEDEDEEHNDKKEGITQRKRRAMLKKTTSLPQEVCIICKQKREDSSLGYLCFIQPSNALKHVTTQYYCHPSSSTSDDDTTASPYSSINSLYRVVALDGCEIHNLPSEASAVVTVIPYNSHVTVGARQGAWFEILTPVRGFGLIYKESNNAVETNPLTSIVVKNGLNVMNRTLSLNYTTILAPVKSLLYEKNGGTRLHISTCTHAMHFDCWDQFYTAAYARFINHERGAEYQGYDVAKGECLCPLCKNILNSILPILPDVTALTTNKKKGSTKKKKSQSDDDSAMDVVIPAVLPPPISTPSTLIKQRSVSDYVTSFFQALNLSSLSAQVTTSSSNTSNTLTQKAKQMFVLSEEDRTKIIRFLDGVHTSTSSMISFPPTINTLTPFRSTIRSLGMTGNTASQLAYESFVNRFLFGDWKILQSSMMMISSFAYTLSFSSYLNLANYLNASSLTQTNSSGDNWLLSNAEQKLLPQMVTVLQRFPSLFHAYSSASDASDDDDDNNSVEETLENPIFTICYQNSLLNLFFCSPKRHEEGFHDTAFAPELLHCLRLFPSFPLIYNLQTAYPDMKTFYDILLQLCRQIAAEKGSQATSSETGVPYEVAKVLAEYYEVFSSPLLSQDLTVVLIALIPILFQQQSSSEGEEGEVEGEKEDRKRWKCLREFSQMLLLAKINQILIDPKITQIFQHSSHYYQSSPKDNKARTTPTEDTILHDEGLRSIYSQLTSLQREIYSILQLPSLLLSALSSNYNDSTNNHKIIGNVLLKEIFQSLIPFLEVLYRFHQLLSVNIYDEDDHHEEGEKEGFDGNDRIYGSYDDVKTSRSLISMDSTKMSLEEKNLHYYQYISYLLKELGLNHLLIILSKIEYIELMKLWNQSYHQYHLQGRMNNKTSSLNDEALVDTVRVNAKNTVNWLPVMDGVKEDQIFQSIDPISALKPFPPSSNSSESYLGGSRKLAEGEEKEKGDSQLLQLLQQSTASYMTSSSTNEALMERDEEEEEEEDGDPRGDDIGVLMDQLVGANPTVAPNGLEELIMHLLQREQRLRQGRGEEEEEEEGEEEDNQMDAEVEEDETIGEVAGRNNNNAANPAAAPPTANEGGGLFAALLGRFRATLNPNPTPAPAANANAPPTNNAGTGRRGLPSLPAITRGRANSNNSISSSQSRQAPKKPAIPAWPYYGVLPTHAFFDELAGKNYPHQNFLKQLAQSSLTRNPLTSSITGHYPILTFNLANSDDISSMIERVPLQYPDLSHFNINLDCLQYLYHRYTFIDLPPLYIDLYHMTKFPEGSDGVTLENPAICLLCGQILCAGRKKNTRSQPDAENPGECTLHAMSCGAGIGAFFIIQACNVLIMRGSRSSYHSTIYLDEHNESNADTNVGYGHNKPMFLSSKRYQKVKELYLQHVMAKEITRKRVHADNVIRQYWY